MRRWLPVLLSVALGAPICAAQQASPYTIDAARSKLELNVYREGFFKFAAHDHLIAAREISGTAHIEAGAIERSSVRFKIAAKSVTVVDAGADEKERRDVQAKMESPDVLDVARYPEITFASTGVAQAKPAGGGYDLMLTGELNLHGVAKAISLPVQVRFSGKELRVHGETFLLQTDFKITPIRIAGGTVRVKDKLKITFDIVATQAQ